MKKKVHFDFLSHTLLVEQLDNAQRADHAQQPAGVRYRRFFVYPTHAKISRFSAVSPFGLFFELASLFSVCRKFVEASEYTLEHAQVWRIDRLYHC
jgi:hypothetical protein